jgi:hypothetical protein
VGLEGRFDDVCAYLKPTCWTDVDGCELGSDLAAKPNAIIDLRLKMKKQAPLPPLCDCEGVGKYLQLMHLDDRRPSLDRMRTVGAIYALAAETSAA